MPFSARRWEKLETNLLFSYYIRGVKQLCSTLKLWHEKMICIPIFYLFHSWKKITNQLFSSKFQCRKQLFLYIDVLQTQSWHYFCEHIHLYNSTRTFIFYSLRHQRQSIFVLVVVHLTLEKSELNKIRDKSGWSSLLTAILEKNCLVLKKELIFFGIYL